MQPTHLKFNIGDAMAWSHLDPFITKAVQKKARPRFCFGVSICRCPCRRPVLKRPSARLFESCGPGKIRNRRQEQAPSPAW